jgi:membrane-bound metal-dependent hydrolase YbcI (DUF457 family)
MDTITHGIAGALIGKAVFGGDDMFVLRPITRGRIVTWSLMLGAIFPDSDIFRDMVSHDELLILTWHRSITHSLLCLPIFALLLAALTRWLARQFQWEAPSFALLSVIYGAGILSHILLDLVTSFGTMIWSPAQWSRLAWDLIFIIDFTLAAILLVPQVLAWVYAKREGLPVRALGSWLIFSVGAIAVYAIAQAVDAPFPVRTTIVCTVILAAIFLLPGIRFWGVRVKRSTWNAVGLVAAIAYIALAISLHHSALERIQKFATEQQLDVQVIGALPMPPSPWHWDGLVRTQRGVYEVPIDLQGGADHVEAAASVASAEVIPLEYRYYPDAPTNSYIEAAKRLSAVQTVLWFARFPVTRFHKEGRDALVDVSDMRFPHLRPDRPAAFTYRVRFDAAGIVLEQGWVRDKRGNKP